MSYYWSLLTSSKDGKRSLRGCQPAKKNASPFIECKLHPKWKGKKYEWMIECWEIRQKCTCMYNVLDFLTKPERTYWILTLLLLRLTKKTRQLEETTKRRSKLVQNNGVFLLCGGNSQGLSRLNCIAAAEDELNCRAEDSALYVFDSFGACLRLCWHHV